MELIGKQIAIETILGQPPELHYPSWYAAQIEKLPPAPPEYLAEQAGILATDADTISRAKAIEALKNDMASLDHIIKGMSANDVRLDAYVSQRNQVNYDIYTINNLPPAQPEQLGTNLAEVGTDCISRQAAIDTLRGYLVGKRCPDDGTLTCRLIENEVINKLPPAQPEIIRCKDCKHFKQVFAPNDNDGLCGHWHSKCDARTSQEGYCSHAERRNDTE